MTRKSKARLVFGACLLGATTTGVAQIAQEPLLNRLNSVAPNLVLILDTSGSMIGSSIYEYGDPSATGPIGPGDDGTPRAARSPDVNKLYYDPRVRYRPRVNYDGTPLPQDPPTTSTFQVFFRNSNYPGPYTTGGSLIRLDAYWNSQYIPISGSVVAGSSANYPVNVSSNLPSSTVFPKFIGRTDCASYPTASNPTACTLTEERQNHSNWNKWYKTRALMAQTGLGAALQPVVPDSVRLGFGTIKKLREDEQLHAGVSSFSSGSDGGKQRLFSWLYSQTFADGTPNLHAVNNVGKYYERTDSDGPWATTPNPSSIRITTDSAPSGPGRTEPPSSHASCRRSTSLLVTDGYWNGGQPTTAGNADNTGFSIAPAVGPVFSYTPSAPYADSYANTLADIAMHYWGRDLRPDLPNRVPTLTTTAGPNPSTWQNTSFYAVTLGLLGTLPRTSTVTADLNGGRTSWPQPQENQPTTIDDTWHATINGRGELLNANNSQELTDAISRILTGIAGTPQTQSGVAVSATLLRNGTRKYKPEYVPGAWTGRLSAVELDPATGNDKVPPLVHWQVDGGLDANGEPVSTIPAFGARKVYTWSGSAGLVFNSTNTGLSTDLVNYIRGDSSRELRKPGGIFRNRTGRLGDIVNSNPVFVRENVDLQYEKLGIDGYRDFVATKSARPGLLFVGANDGMLHAFRDSDGQEVFAYVPRAVVPELHKLGETPFVHRYYVDGPNVETDAFIGSMWRNVLLGTTGAGAKAVYALDVTFGYQPQNLTQNQILWEVNATTPGFAQLGHVLSDVQAGMTVNGQWIAVFGNGFGSTGGNASFFVVDLLNGGLLRELTTPATGSNGMGGVKLVLDANRRVVGGYAGDLRGNLWKLDLTGDPADWKIGLDGNPLYAGGNTRPITAPPAVLRHEERGGHVVAFGSGKFFETSDASPPYNPQRLHGIWDAQPFGATSTPPGASLSGTTNLVRRTIGTVTVGGVEFYTVSSGPITWGDGIAGLRGWYMDLPNSGQRVVNPLEQLDGTFLLASTLSPESSSAPDVCMASGSGSGWVYIIDGLTGSGPTKSALDTNADGTINDMDQVVSGYRDVVDGRPSPIRLQATATGTRLCIETAQSTCTQIRLECGQQGSAACPSTTASRIKSRSWRQLFMR